MISPVTLHVDLRRRLNRFDSSWGQKLNVAKIDSILNEAVEIFVDNRLSLVETNNKVREDLRQLERKYEDLKIIKTTAKYVIAEYPEDCLKILRSSALVHKDPCGDRDITVRRFQSQQLNDSLNSPFWKPSYEYEETIGDEESRGFLVYHNGEFTIKNVFVDYIRKPKEIRTPSMTEKKRYSIGGKVYEEDQGLELTSTQQARKILDIAALIAARDMQDYQDFEAQLAKILQTERLHISQQGKQLFNN